MAKCREFGRVRQLPSGRWQARYPLDDGVLATAADTFETKREAVQYLDRVSTDMQLGEWTRSSPWSHHVRTMVAAVDRRSSESAAEYQEPL
jgi:hypothetical protein